MTDNKIIINAIVKKIGGSLGILIPKYFIKEYKIKENDRLEIIIKKMKVWKVTKNNE